MHSLTKICVREIQVHWKNKIDKTKIKNTVYKPKFLTLSKIIDTFQNS
jgi:hypothetical protein